MGNGMIKMKGFSLIELMIALVIVAILVGVGYPTYQSSVTKSRRTDAKASLMEIATKMEKYYFQEKTYTADLTNLGYGAAASVASPEGFYLLSVSATGGCDIATCYVLTAVPQGPQVSDGNFILRSNGQKEPVDKW